MTGSEIKVAHGRKKLHQGNHKHDWGSDLGPMEGIPMTTGLVAEGGLSPAIVHPFMNDDVFCSGSAEFQRGRAPASPQ